MTINLQVPLPRCVTASRKLLSVSDDIGCHAASAGKPAARQESMIDGDARVHTAQGLNVVRVLELAKRRPRLSYILQMHYHAIAPSLTLSSSAQHLKWVLKPVSMATTKKINTFPTGTLFLDG